MSVSDTYEYLCGVFSDVDTRDIEGVLLNYVNGLCGVDYFIDNAGVCFQSLFDVNMAFNSVYERSKIS